MRNGWPARVIGLLCSLAIGGCGGSPAPAKGSDSEVKKLGIVYMRFVGTHRGQGPASREEFAQFVADMKPEDLKAMGIKDAKDMFKSSRDDQEIVVRYGIPIPPPGGGDPTVVAYEGQGVNGKRLVVYGTAGVEEITAERLKKLVPDAK